MQRIILIAFTTILFQSAIGQMKMDFETYDPVNTLVVPKHPLSHSNRRTYAYTCRASFGPARTSKRSGSGNPAPEFQ